MAVFFSDTSHDGDVLSASRKRMAGFRVNVRGLHAGWGTSARILTDGLFHGSASEREPLRHRMQHNNHRYRMMSTGAVVLFFSMMAQICSGVFLQPRRIHSQIIDETAETRISSA